MNRQEDLSKVFDRTWKANHSDMVTRERKREISFINKMFNVNDRSYKESVNGNTPGMRALGLKKKIDTMSDIERKNRMDNILKKWK